MEDAVICCSNRFCKVDGNTKYIKIKLHVIEAEHFLS